MYAGGPRFDVSEHVSTEICEKSRNRGSTILSVWKGIIVIHFSIAFYLEFLSCLVAKCNFNSKIFCIVAIFLFVQSVAFSFKCDVPLAVPGA